MYSGNGVCAGHAHWQSTTLWKYAGSAMFVGCNRGLLTVRHGLPCRGQSTPGGRTPPPRVSPGGGRGSAGVRRAVGAGHAQGAAAAREPLGREVDAGERLAEIAALHLVPAVFL